MVDSWHHPQLCEKIMKQQANVTITFASPDSRNSDKDRLNIIVAPRNFIQGVNLKLIIVTLYPLFSI